MTRTERLAKRRDAETLTLSRLDAASAGKRWLEDVQNRHHDYSDAHQWQRIGKRERFALNP